MAMRKRKVYDRSFKENGVQLSLIRSDLSTLARELGVSSDLLYSWRSEYRKKGAESFPGKGNVGISQESKSEHELLKRIKRLEQENEILKKAMGIISKSDL